MKPELERDPIWRTVPCAKVWSWGSGLELDVGDDKVLMVNSCLWKGFPFCDLWFWEQFDLSFLLRRSWSRKELQTALLGKWFKYFHSDSCSKQEMSLFSLAKEGLFKYLQKMVLPRDCRTNSMKKSPKPIMSFVQCDLIIIHQRVEAKSWNPSATQSTRALLSSSRGTSFQTCLQVWWVITDNSIRQWWLRWHSWFWESTIKNDNADNQCFQSLVFFSSDHIGNLTVELILASAEVIFKNRKILSAMEVASSYKLISLLTMLTMLSLPLKVILLSLLARHKHSIVACMPIRK